MESTLWKIISRKYDGSVHRIWTSAYPLQPRPLYKSETLPVFSLLIPARTLVEEGNGDSWSSSYNVVACFYAAKYFQVMMLQKRSGLEFYCNCCTVAEIDESRQEVRFIDMDLDVLVDANSSMRVVDHEEFAENRELYKYPEDLCLRVEEDLEDLKRQVRQRRGVFAPHYAATHK